MVAKRRRPSTGEMKLDLRDLSIRPDAANPDVMAWIDYEAPIGAYYPSTSPGKLAPMRALLSWLESIRTSADDDTTYAGGPVDLTPVSGAELFAAMTNRKYSLNFHGLIYDFVIDSTTQYTNQQIISFPYRHGGWHHRNPGPPGVLRGHHGTPTSRPSRSMLTLSTRRPHLPGRSQLTR